MTHTATYQPQFEEQNVCVIIPTYNNAKTLACVIEDVAAYTTNIIIVNDGSVDDTSTILLAYTHFDIVGYSKNMGKGWALRQGLQRAHALGYDYAITIDSDGQHFAKDLPVFLEKVATDQHAIIIGSRNMNQEFVPGKSSFGNKFSSFWFRVETGIKAPDTQSGYRLYPLQPLSKKKFITRKYEFEIEVLVRAAWSGVGIASVPVSVYYAPKETRVSHFRPFKDFTRISILNTVLVLITFLYIKPRDFFKSIVKKETWRSLWYDEFLKPSEPDIVKAASVAFGIFMGIVPVWGFQLVIAIFLSIILKLNKPIVIVAANISIPPMIPVIIFLSYIMGSYWMGDHAIDFSFNTEISFDAIKQNLRQYIYGSITLAVVAGITAGLLTLVLLKIFKKKQAAAVQE